MSNNKNMHKAKTEKNDEFYTRLSDIENEISKYKDCFKGKTVLCNCDYPFESNFFKFFALQFKNLGLKKLITTCYYDSGIKSQGITLFDEGAYAMVMDSYIGYLSGLYSSNKSKYSSRFSVGKFVNQQMLPNFLVVPSGCTNSFGEVQPFHSLFSLINGKISLYVISFIFPIIRNCFLCSISKATNSRNFENAGIVTTMSASSSSLTHSGIAKTPVSSILTDDFLPSFTRVFFSSNHHSTSCKS